MEAGPRSVCLHLEGTSCVGIVATKGSALQANLAGPGGMLLSKLSDIQAMIKDTESTSSISPSSIVCMPIQPSPSSATGNGVKGALLLGFSSPPNLSPRRTAGLMALCSMLSETLAYSSPAVLCHVESMIGRHLGCACCSPDSDDDEMELENEDINADPCHDKGSGKKDRGNPPRQPLLIPIEEGEEEEGRCSGESSGNTTPRAEKGWKGENSACIEWVKPSTSTPPAATPPAPQCHFPAPPSVAVNGHQFSKAATLSVTRESLRARHPLTLSYTDPTLEREFSSYFHNRSTKIDVLFSMLVVTSMILLAYCSPNTVANAVKEGSMSLFVALPLLLPTCMAAVCSAQLYQRLREVAVACIRLYLVICASRSAASQLASETAASWLACWIAAGGETLFTPTFGFQIRMKHHLPLQAAAVSIMCYNAQSICSPSFYASAGFLPYKGIVNYLCTIATAGLVGFVLPTVLLRVTEQKCRRQFEDQLGAAAGITAAA